jgi:large-conductance mechanosensitive channel
MSQSLLGQTAFDSTNSILNLQKNFSNFTSYNGTLIIYAAAVCIGFATKDMISDIMNTAILPFLLFWSKHSIIGLLFIKIIDKFKKYPTFSLFLIKIGSIFWIILVWIIILWLTYFIFTKLIKVDVISNRVYFLQDIIKYATKQEQSYINKEEKTI